MRIKKGFTLAEILIVLMVIGVIATLTIPSMMKGVVDAQIKAGYKKAFNVISNLSATEKVAGYLPSTNISSETMRYFLALNNSLSVKAYVSNGISPVNSGRIVRNDEYASSIKIDGTTLGSGGKSAGEVTRYSITTFGPSPWIVTEDNIAYSVMCGGRTGVPAKCATAAQIAAQRTQLDAILNSCSVVIVDVNGLSKGPNTFDPQAGDANGSFKVNDFGGTIDANSPLQILSGDQYLIFVGIDGASAGSQSTTITGRIIADLK